jgi:hypothetical protein
MKPGLPTGLEIIEFADGTLATELISPNLKPERRLPADIFDSNIEYLKTICSLLNYNYNNIQISIK